MTDNQMLLNITGGKSGNSEFRKSGNKEANRASNFELLRLVCMLLIICGHIIMIHGYDTVGDSSWYIKQILWRGVQILRI